MTLPKSVKVRSTCNACQQAKIRCSHEKPSCRRCQKHNIDCVYSISRRLGRPAKKRDPDEKKRKPKKELMDDTHEIDFNTDSWLQDFITDVPETSSSFLDSGSSSNSGSSNRYSHSQNPLEPISPSMISAPASTMPDCADLSLSSSSYYSQSLFQASPETFDMGLLPMDMDTSTSPADTVPSISNPVSPQQPLPGNTPLGIQPQPSLRPFEYEYLFPDSTGIGLEPYTPTPHTLAPAPPAPAGPAGDQIGLPACPCHCHEQTLHEVIRLNMMLCATSRISPSMARPASAGVNINMNIGMGNGGLGTGTLDMILNIQCGLQNLTEVVLQCTLCAENRATLLALVMVNIDALVGVMDRVAAVLVSSSSSSSVATAMAGGGGPRADAVKGGFQTPVEEKYAFVRQVFLGKLGALLALIRRIRFCMQEMLVNSSSRAQFVMMMETDRRLQMVIMRMRMGT